MEPINVVIWSSVCVCLSLTILVICCLWRVVQRKQVPVIYYTNLLISNLIQIGIFINIGAKGDDHTTSSITAFIYFFGVVASVYFKLCIALERSSLITCPLLDCIRQTNCSVLVSVMIWILCIVSVPLAIVLEETLRLIIYALFPAPLFIFCLAGTLKALPAATSVPTEEKRRIVGTLILLLLNYFLMVLPTIFFHMLLFFLFHIFWFVLLLSPFVDLVLYFVMQKGPIEKLLACLCCCSMENTLADVAAHHQCD